MLKKIIKAFSFFALLQVLIYSCCSDEYLVYYNNMTLEALDRLDQDSSNVASENLVLDISFDYNFVLASHFKPLKPLTNSTYATSCEEEYSLRDIVFNVLVTTDVALFGIAPGNPLNDFLFFINPYTFESQNIEGLISYLNTTNNYGPDSIQLIFREPLPSDISLAFSMKLDLVDGGRLDSTTETITIE